MTLRVIKTILVFIMAALFSFAAFTDAVDYQVNFAFLQKVLSMSTLPADSPFLWRAITDHGVHVVAYVVLVLFEVSAALLLWAAGFKMWCAIKTEQFQAAKILANVGLFVALFLCLFGIVAVGAEWFCTWQSTGSNPQYTAGLYSGLILLVMIYLNHKD